MPLSANCQLSTDVCCTLIFFFVCAATRVLQLVAQTPLPAATRTDSREQRSDNRKQTVMDFTTVGQEASTKEHQQEQMNMHPYVYKGQDHHEHNQHHQRPDIPLGGPIVSITIGPSSRPTSSRFYPHRSNESSRPSSHKSLRNYRQSW
jgi:hypothetical protein